MFHYEQDHESLEEEVFELHTQNKADETDPVHVEPCQDETEQEEPIIHHQEDGAVLLPQKNLSTSQK